MKTIRPQVGWTLLFLGILFLFHPTLILLYESTWRTEEQGHGPIVLVISIFLLWQKRAFFLNAHTNSGNHISGLTILVTGLIFLFVGRTLNIISIEVGSLVIVVLGIFRTFTSKKSFNKLLFPVCFLFFMIPLPGSLVDAITMPMKIAVSSVVESFLYVLEYPIARTGVILQIGYYQLLVADACAGLHTVFTLEAMGLLYLHLIKRDSFFRNVTLAILIIPISFLANVVRVLILVLVTFYYGDEVGQGFIHDFAGLVLFGTALMFIIIVDSSLHFFSTKISSFQKRYNNEIK